MADVESRDHEDDVLRDVRGMVADPLEVPRNQDEVECGLDRRPVLQHAGQKFAKHEGFQRVEPVVFAEDAFGQGGVTLDEGVERVAQHDLRDSPICGMSMSFLTGAWFV